MSSQGLLFKVTTGTAILTRLRSTCGVGSRKKMSMMQFVTQRAGRRELPAAACTDALGLPEVWRRRMLWPATLEHLSQRERASLEPAAELDAFL